MNTYGQQLDLVQRGLAHVSINANLSTFKYSRKVMYDYLWHTEPLLLECRGHTYDNQNGTLVQLPFRKSFNYLEDNYWADVPLDTPVQMYKKYNGFMAAATLYDDQLIVSTSGTTDSSYADIARKHIETLDSSVRPLVISKGWTALFEIIDPEDPHIVEEAYKLRYLGCRAKDTGQFLPSGDYIECSLGRAMEITQEDRGEGFMVYRLDDEMRLSPCKMKTPYYVGKKKLMRMTPNKIDMMYNPVQFRTIENGLPEMWKDAVGEITDCFTAWEWKNKPSQERRVFLEKLKG